VTNYYKEAGVMKFFKYKPMIFLTVLFLLAGFVSLCWAVNTGTKTVGEITALNYNAVLKQFLEQDIRVYVDNEGYTYIGSGTVIRANAYFTDEERLQVIALLEKGLEWSEKARKNQVELTKELGSVKTNIGNDYSEHYNGIDLVFFAARKGKQTDVIITIYDFDNMFAKEELYMDNTVVQNLIDLLKNAPDTIAKLKEEEKIGEDFQ
jgi:hypothetical protein